MKIVIVKMFIFCLLLILGLVSPAVLLAADKAVILHLEISNLLGDWPLNQDSLVKIIAIVENQELRFIREPIVFDNIIINNVTVTSTINGDNNNIVISIF